MKLLLPQDILKYPTVYTTQLFKFLLLELLDSMSEEASISFEALKNFEVSVENCP
jgi:hypothetical protein